MPINRTSLSGYIVLSILERLHAVLSVTKSSLPFCCRVGAMGRITQNYQKQLAILLDVTDENDSWYIDQNILNANITLAASQSLDDLKEDEDFKVLWPFSYTPNSRWQCGYSPPPLPPK